MEMDSNPITKPSKKGTILSTVFYALAVVLLITAFVCSCGGAADYSFYLPGGLPSKYLPAA